MCAGMELLFLGKGNEASISRNLEAMLQGRAESKNLRLEKHSRNRKQGDV